MQMCSRSTGSMPALDRDWTNMIQINGLTKEQCDMLDIIWSFQTKEDYVNWYDCLDENEQDMAGKLLILLALAMVDEEDTGNYAEANAVLSKFRLKKD